MMTMKRILSLAVLLGTATAASAHTGHGTHSLFAGLAHPFGLDHLLAMLAVGLWSARVLPAAQRWQGPLCFLSAMSLGALLGAVGVSLPGTELAIAASVVVMGAMLLAGERLPQRSGLGLIAAAAALHGLAHGAELPAGGLFAGYATGFVATTALLHAAGLGLGRAMADLQVRVWQALGGAVGLTGLVLLARG